MFGNLLDELALLQPSIPLKISNGVCLLQEAHQRAVEHLISSVC